MSDNNQNEPWSSVGATNKEDLARAMIRSIRKEGWSSVVDVLTDGLGFVLVSQTSVVRNAAGVQITIKIPDVEPIEPEELPENMAVMQMSFDESGALHTIIEGDDPDYAPPWLKIPPPDENPVVINTAGKADHPLAREKAEELWFEKEEAE